MSRRVVIAGAGGRDFHDFNMVFRNNRSVGEVVAFTATQIPGIDDRRYPAELAGPGYPDGIPIRPEHELVDIINAERVDEVVFSYSDVEHVHVMHLASQALAAGSGFRLLPPRLTMLASPRPVVAVVATRTGAGKSPTSRRVGRLLLDAGLRVALIRHPMPYGDLSAMRVQRFGSLSEIDAASPSVEEREEYEEPVRQGMVIFAGVDYQAIMEAAAAEADVIVWDGGNNDTPFLEPTLSICVLDPLRSEDGLKYHPGEVNLRMADVFLVNKINAATDQAVGRVLADARSVNPEASVIRAASPLTLDPGPELVGRRVLVIEDGPTVTHGGMPHGAGLEAARHAGAVIVDPRPWAVGSIAETYDRYPHLGPVLPAMGYGDTQLADLGRTARAVECDVAVTGTPMDLARIIELGHPTRHTRYTVQELGRPDLGDVLAPWVEQWLTETRA
ncbi:MAG: GTPase [Actinomycetia bacterium]|nr:GTPase [Actinomycetes bacterium]MCP5033783.1 GTPase [Actinomycetes bacterium]